MVAATPRSRSLLLRLVLALVFAATLGPLASAQRVLRQEAVVKTLFRWTEDPHAADPCTEPGCSNHVKFGYDVEPVNVTTGGSIVFQEARRPAGLAAVLKLEVYTQPGCVARACTTKKILGFIPKVDCFNDFGEKKATEEDGVTARLHFGGNFYENLPAGELFAQFDRTNFLTRKKTCTFEVRSGFKRFF